LSIPPGTPCITGSNINSNAQPQQTLGQCIAKRNTSVTGRIYLTVLLRPEQLLLRWQLFSWADYRTFVSVEKSMHWTSCCIKLQLCAGDGRAIQSSSMCNENRLYISLLWSMAAVWSRLSSTWSWQVAVMWCRRKFENLLMCNKWCWIFFADIQQLKVTVCEEPFAVSVMWAKV